MAVILQAAAVLLVWFAVAAWLGVPSVWPFAIPFPVVLALRDHRRDADDFEGKPFEDRELERDGIAWL